MSLVRSIFNFLRFNKKNWKAVALCIFAATVFWFFNALNKNYATNISFPIAFEYDEDRYVPVKPLPTVVRMNVTGSGWDLFRRSSGFKIPPLIIPLEKPAATRKIVGSTLPGILASQLDRLQINFVITDTVRIHIERKSQKKFTVALDSVQQYLHPEYGVVTKPVVSPDTILLSGPENIIKDFPEPIPLSLRMNNLKKNFSEEVELNLKHGDLVTPAPKTVTVTLNVEKFVVVNTHVKLNILNVPSRLKQGGVIKQVSCSYRLPETTLKKFTGDSLVAIIDLKNKPKGSYKLVPEIHGLPATASLVKTDTVLVNF